MGLAGSGRGKRRKGTDGVGEEWGGERWKEKSGGKGGGGKGWRRERLKDGKGGEEKGTEGWGRKLGSDWGLCSSKNYFKSRGPRPTLTLRQIVAPVQDLVYAHAVYMQSGPYSKSAFSAFA